jgi:hypothetical protein
MGALSYIDAYKTGINSFPKDDLPLSKKDEKWHLAYAKAIMADYANDRCGIAYSRREQILKNRRWAFGTNSEEEFKNIIYEFDVSDEEKQAFTNLDTSIIPIISKFRRVFIGILSGSDHRVSANSIDPTAVRQKDMQKFMLWMKKAFKPQLDKIDPQLGIPQDPNEYLPESKAELEMYDQLGGFKLALEEVIEGGMNHCFYTSRWDEEIRPRVIGDLFDSNACACRDYFDLKTFTVKQRYVDIANYIGQASDSPVFDNSRYHGEVKWYSIADLRVMTGWDEDKLSRIAQKASGQNGNASVASFSAQRGNEFGPFQSSPYYEYDPLLTPVVELEFASTLYEYDVEKTDANGNKRYFPTDRDRQYDTYREDRKSITTAVKVWHKVSHILGTEEVFDFGLQHDIPRPTFEDARSSFHAIKLEGQSLNESSQPHAKQVQLGYLQIQNMIAKSAPAGIAVEWDALTGMTYNKKELSPFNLLKIRRQTGDIIYHTTTARGHMQGHGGVPPLRDVKGSYEINDFIALIEHHISQIREITGVNDQGGRDADTATGAKLSFMTTDISLKTLFNAYIAIYRESAVNASARLRDLLAYSSQAREIYGPILGMSKIDLLDIVKDLPTAHLSIKIEISPSDEDKKEIQDAAIAAMKPGKQGMAVLGFGDYLFITRLIKSGNIKSAQAWIAYKETKNSKDALKAEELNQKLNQEGAIAQQDKKTSDEIERMKRETDEKLRYERELVEIQKPLEQQKHDWKMEELRLQAQTKQTQSELAAI